MIDEKVPRAKEHQELSVMPVASDCVPVKVPAEAEDLEDVEDSERDSWRNLVAFWILGLCNNYGYVVMLSAAHDILARHHEADPHPMVCGNGTMIETERRHCNYMSTGAVLLADIIPSLLTKIVAPFFPLWVHFRMMLIIILSCAGYILVGASETQWVAILGVVATAFSSGLGEATLLSYMPFFKNKNVISTWSSGTGGAGFFGSLSYAGLTALGLSPSTTLYVLLVVPALMSFTFWVVLKRPHLEDSGSSTPPELSGSSTFNSSDRVPLTLTNDSFYERLCSIPPLFKYMIPLGLVYFFEYFINQGLIELIYFDNIFIDNAEQYRWYQVDYQIGVFISRSSINLLQIKAIWLVAVFQGLNVIGFTFEAVYSYLPNIYIVLAAVFWEGLLGGAAYVNTFHRINTEVVPEKREFSMAITSLADAVGITLSGFLAMPVHNYICCLPRYK